VHDDLGLAEALRGYPPLFFRKILQTRGLRVKIANDAGFRDLHHFRALPFGVRRCGKGSVGAGLERCVGRDQGKRFSTEDTESAQRHTEFFGGGCGWAW
jgi:hypothetical protein